MLDVSLDVSLPITTGILILIDCGCLCAVGATSPVPVPVPLISCILLAISAAANKSLEKFDTYY